MDLPASILTKHQVITFGPVFCPEYNQTRDTAAGPVVERAEIVAQVRHDDSCGNGHNSFSITGEVTTPRLRRQRDCLTAGCIHDEVAKHFPKLAPLIKFHLFSTDGPLHYVANTLYHAGDRDCWGLKKDETRQIVNGQTKELCWVRKGIGSEYHDGPTCPEGVITLSWGPLLRIGEGKERDLEAARRCACWPEATDAELMQEPEALKAQLLARLPALMVEFKAAVESLGMVY